MRWPTLPGPLQSHSTVRILQFCLWLISWNVRQLHYKYLFQIHLNTFVGGLFVHVLFLCFTQGRPGQLPINWSVKTAILCPHSLTGFLSGKPAGSLNVEQYERRSRCQQPGVKILNNRSKKDKKEKREVKERERALHLPLFLLLYTWKAGWIWGAGAAWYSISPNSGTIHFHNIEKCCFFLTIQTQLFCWQYASYFQNLSFKTQLPQKRKTKMIFNTLDKALAT